MTSLEQTMWAVCAFIASVECQLTVLLVPLALHPSLFLCTRTKQASVSWLRWREMAESSILSRLSRVKLFES